MWSFPPSFLYRSLSPPPSDPLRINPAKLSYQQRYRMCRNTMPTLTMWTKLCQDAILTFCTFPVRLLHSFIQSAGVSTRIAVTASFSQQTEDRAFCPVVQLLWLRASHCTDYHVTSLLFLRVTCHCSLRTYRYATLKFIRSSSSSSSSSCKRANTHGSRWFIFWSLLGATRPISSETIKQLFVSKANGYLQPPEYPRWRFESCLA